MQQVLLVLVLVVLLRFLTLIQTRETTNIMFRYLVTKAFADSTGSSGVGSAIINKLNDAIINPLIKLLFAVAFLFFLYGIVEFIAGGGNPQKKKTGQEHMFYGVIGLFIMIAVFGIINLIANFLGAPTI